mmetsp:Transcript_6481/g.13524  ORF Transcript_6481/g.13524 Transcript_6481/m.13524 type:complete len:83 (+) Transcript_6481:386-634(+)|eukprot:CAMPEP_0172468820 /NCGR_PEP_ID=MMETSP1065-20121228/62181_1 /TAXON_ID=265537 /ORGANISM="Amphiprora paludosa, Strain CCMP125" /LENGTH=82 /DNA_ID=CAMNT_0013226295 /DNA_START=351 /DNA_END=599 /DNA_ORIENTATION=+
MGYSILSKFDDMGRQLDELEAHVDSMMEHVNVEKTGSPPTSPSNVATSKVVHSINGKSSLSPIQTTPKAIQQRRNRSQPCEV